MHSHLSGRRRRGSRKRFYEADRSTGRWPASGQRRIAVSVFGGSVQWPRYPRLVIDLQWHGRTVVPGAHVPRAAARSGGPQCHDHVGIAVRAHCQVERLVVDAPDAEDASAPRGDNGVADAVCAEVLRHRVETQPDGEVPAVVLRRKPRQPGAERTAAGEVVVIGGRDPTSSPARPSYQASSLLTVWKNRPLPHMLSPSGGPSRTT